MAKDLKYFMRSQEEEIVTVPGPESIKDEDGNVVELEIRVLSQSDIRRIMNNYKKRTIAVDKRGQPYIAGGEVVYKTEKDNDKASRHLIVEALVYPDLKDKELMAYYGCVDVTDMPLKVFPKADEYNHVSRAVMTALGLVESTDESGAIEDAKN